MYVRPKYKVLIPTISNHMCTGSDFRKTTTSKCMTEPNSYSRYRDNALMFQISLDNHIDCRFGLLCR